MAKKAASHHRFARFPDSENLEKPSVFQGFSQSGNQANRGWDVDFIDFLDFQCKNGFPQKAAVFFRFSDSGNRAGWWYTLLFGPYTSRAGINN